MNYSDTALEMSRNGTIGLVKYYVLLMKITYNKVVLNEKKKRKLEKDILKIAEKYKLTRDMNVLRDIENVILIL